MVTQEAITPPKLVITVVVGFCFEFITSLVLPPNQISIAIFSGAAVTSVLLCAFYICAILARKRKVLGDK